MKDKHNNLKERCPNCIKPDPMIKKMKNGKCGVCGGKGFIIWKIVGKLEEVPIFHLCN